MADLISRGNFMLTALCVILMLQTIHLYIGRLDNCKRENAQRATKQSAKMIIEDNLCLPRRKVIFLKTHKTASSTLQNVFFRFGDKYGLNFALPKSNGAKFNYPKPIKPEFIKPLAVSDYQYDKLDMCT